MNVKRLLKFALAGWVAGIIAVVGLGLVWPIFFPAVNEPTHYYGSVPGMPAIIGITLLIVTPVAIIGGLIGSRLAREGGSTEQALTAAFLGAVLVLPVACCSMWAVTGY